MKTQESATLLMQTSLFIPLFLLGCGLGSFAIAQDSKPLYENNFESAELNSVPSDFLVLDGGFKVKEEGGNKFLELPGAPLDSFAVLFGATEKAGVTVSARAFGTSKGRRTPTFGIGVNGVGGYKLQVAPAKKQLELLKGDEVKASVPYTWESGKWTELLLQTRKQPEGGVVVEGKAWTEGTPKPAAWTIVFEDKTEPSAGRASLIASPYSGTPIRFDNLQVARVGKD